VLPIACVLHWSSDACALLDVVGALVVCAGLWPRPCGCVGAQRTVRQALQCDASTAAVLGMDESGARVHVLSRCSDMQVAEPMRARLRC
jgi:hypothetical protein